MELNEGLEKLGAKEIVYGSEHAGKVFYGTAIESVRLPSTLKRIETKTFESCRSLRKVEIPNGGEYIGKDCFMDSGIEEITLPSTLKELDEKAFSSCSNLKTIWVEAGCALDIKQYVKDSVEVRQE